MLLGRAAIVGAVLVFALVPPEPPFDLTASPADKEDDDSDEQV